MNSKSLNKKKIPSYTNYKSLKRTYSNVECDAFILQLGNDSFYSKKGLSSFKEDNMVIFFDQEAAQEVIDTVYSGYKLRHVLVKEGDVTLV